MTFRLHPAGDDGANTYTTGSNRAGKDFYIYACVPSSGTEPVIKISANSTVPTGYTAETSRKVGGFHCLCADVGTISGHTLSDYVAGDILPCSVWDLSHRPKSEPEGMVYVEGIDLWVDIYFCSYEGAIADNNLKLISQYGATIADGTSKEAFHSLKFEYYMLKQKKRLPWVREFRSFALGTGGNTNITPSKDPNTTGGHISSGTNHRIISYYGVEDCCGASWQCCSDYGACSTNGTWTDINDGCMPYDANGFFAGPEYRALVGGGWGTGSYCGVYSTRWYDSSTYYYQGLTAHGVSEPLKN